MKKSFSELPEPLIVSSTRCLTPAEAVADIKEAESAGAKAFTFHIQKLRKEHQNHNALREIAAATEYPVMAINYRTENGADDEHRAAIMRDAVRAGFRSVDVPMYLYDSDTQSSLHLCELPFASANPKEVSMRPEAIVRQKEFIKELKDMGAEVLMSAHVGVELSTEQAVSLAMEIQSRGADIVKIITDCKSPEQQLEVLHTNLELKKVLKTPFVYTCSGKYSGFVRYNAPLFGTMLVFCNLKCGAMSVVEMPLIHDAKEFYRIMGI